MPVQVWRPNEGNLIHRARVLKTSHFTEVTMKIFVLSAITAFAVAVSASGSVQAASIPGWCANSGFDNGPPRSRGPAVDLTGRENPPIASRSGEGATIEEPIPIRTSGCS